MSAMLLQYTISGIMPLISVSLLGGFLAYKKVFTNDTIQRISKSFTNFTSPVFVFFNIAGSINLEKLTELWPLFLSPSLMLLLGYFLSLIHSKFFKELPNLPNVMTCILTFSSIGNLPIVLMKGICSPYGPLRGNKYCDDANSYISLQIITYSAIMWSIGNSLIEKEKEEHLRSILTQKLLEEGKEAIVLADVSIFRSTIKNLFLPVPLACFFGLIIGLIPGVREIFYNKNSILYTLAETFLNIGIGGVILVQMTLGANLMLLSSGNKTISKTFITSMVIFKNFVTPICALGLIYIASIFKVFGNNTVMIYIIFISFCCPTAIVIMVLTQNHQHGTKETSLLMFWIYIFSVPSLIISSYLFFLIF